MPQRSFTRADSCRWPLTRFQAAADPRELWLLTGPRHVFSGRDAALAAALEQIRAPAYVLTPTGEVRETNGCARERLRHAAPEVAFALLASFRANDVEETLELTPLRDEKELVGFLAIERCPPAPRSAKKADRLAQAALRWELTSRQVQVLSLLADGSSNARIAATLGISDRTAEDHVAAILLRARAGTRGSLMAGLLE